LFSARNEDLPVATAQHEYRQAHRRVVDVKGPANLKPCAFCGAFAKEWAYDHQDPRETFRDGYLWSDSTAHYMPLCKRDHRAYDRAFRQHGKAVLPAVIDALTEAGRDRYPDETRQHVEASCDNALRIWDAATPPKEYLAVPPEAKKATTALLSAAYEKAAKG
jgi:hypothetical protein